MPGLFDPITIAGLTLKNRLVLPPMGTRRATPEGAITEAHLAHYAARARAGVGLVIVEHSYVEEKGRFVLQQVGVHDDSLIPGLRRLAEAVRQAGAAICLQINHAGAMAQRDVIGEQPVAPSAALPPYWTAPSPEPADREPPRALTREEIKRIVDLFAKAAERAVAAGFDAVEVHGAHGYLLSEFASPLTNRRTDEYGGSLEGRFRLTMEILREIRSRLGAAYPLLYRFGADDLLPGGLTPADARAIAPRLVEAGADVLDISGGLGGYGERFKHEGYFVPLAQGVKQASGATVIGVGNIRDPHYADKVVREGLIDLVAVGRAQLQDADWAAKAAAVLAT
ncbi:MAG: NADH:flavin oxidoreductase [Chloroflexota bacterium]